MSSSALFAAPSFLSSLSRSSPFFSPLQVSRTSSFSPLGIATLLLLLRRRRP